MLLFYSESCCWQNLVSIITFFKKKEEQFYCAPIQTLKISEHQVYRDQTINSLKSYQLLGWDTWVFLDCEPKSRFFCREIHFESITHLKVRKGCEWLKPLFLHTPTETLILPRAVAHTLPVFPWWLIRVYLAEGQTWNRALLWDWLRITRELNYDLLLQW